MCMNPSIPFISFLKSKQLCTILMSGTLRPFDLIESKLGKKFDSKVFVTPDLNIWKQKLLFLSLIHI